MVDVSDRLNQIVAQRDAIEKALSVCNTAFRLKEYSEQISPERFEQNVKKGLRYILGHSSVLTALTIPIPEAKQLFAQCKSMLATISALVHSDFFKDHYLTSGKKEWEYSKLSNQVTMVKANHISQSHCADYASTTIETLKQFNELFLELSPLIISENKSYNKMCGTTLS